MFDVSVESSELITTNFAENQHIYSILIQLMQSVEGSQPICMPSIVKVKTVVDSKNQLASPPPASLISSSTFKKFD